MKPRFSILLLAVLLAGCESATLDTSSDQALSASIQKMSEGLNATDQQVFQASLMALTLAYDTRGTVQPGGGPIPERKRPAEMLKPLQGLTAQQIIAKAKQFLDDRQKQRAGS